MIEVGVAEQYRVHVGGFEAEGSVVVFFGLALVQTTVEQEPEPLMFQQMAAAGYRTAGSPGGKSHTPAYRARRGWRVMLTPGCDSPG